MAKIDNLTATSTIDDKIAAIEMISAPVASWVRSIVNNGGDWAEVQAEWRKLELLVIGDRRTRH